MYSTLILTPTWALFIHECCVSCLLWKLWYFTPWHQLGQAHCCTIWLTRYVIRADHIKNLAVPSEVLELLEFKIALLKRWKVVLDNRGFDPARHWTPLIMWNSPLSHFCHSELMIIREDFTPVNSLPPKFSAIFLIISWRVECMSKTESSFTHAIKYAAGKAHAPGDPSLGKQSGCPWMCQQVAVFRAPGLAGAEVSWGHQVL